MNFEEQIEKMYAANLASTKEQLKQDYTQADAELAAEKANAQKTTDSNLTRTAVESQKAAMNNAELHNAYGLSSGTRAQARLSQENQLQADLTGLRMQQQQVDADVERQRSILSQEYASAIREAQAENDLAKAQALYERAQLEEDRLLQQQLAAQQLAAEQEVARAKAAQEAAETQQKNELELAKLLAQETGDYTALGKLYGANQSQIDTLNGKEPQPAKFSDIKPVLDSLIQATTFPGSDGFNQAVKNQVYGPNYSAVWDQRIKDAMVTPTKTNRTDDFINSVGSAENWETVSRSGNGYKDYKEYLETRNNAIKRRIDSALSQGQLTEGEAAYLMIQYGLIG